MGREGGKKKSPPPLTEPVIIIIVVCVHPLLMTHAGILPWLGSNIQGGGAKTNKKIGIETTKN